jgi:acetoin:2,6-dichlorophenolindophenol oxidoreductase subunit beta
MPWTTVAMEELFVDDGFFQGDKQGRQITFGNALLEAQTQALRQDPRVFVMGQGADDPKGIFGTTLDLHKEFGAVRNFDTPIAENSMTGIAMGAAVAGLRPIIVHMRMDFLMVAMDQIVNEIAKWKYMSGGKVSVPLVIRTIIGRGWGSAAQHSQSLQAMFTHIPGLKVVMPSTPYDAKGTLIASIMDDSPVIFIEHRWLYNYSGYVPEHVFGAPLGKGAVRREGGDVTVVAISIQNIEALKAAVQLEDSGIDVEVVDPVTLKPLDEDIIFQSVKKTGRLVIADTGNINSGFSAEIAARVSEKCFADLKAPIIRIGAPDTPVPASSILEKAYYTDQSDIQEAVRKVIEY